MPDILEPFHQHITLPPHQKVYFASDFHLGSPDWQSSQVREKKIVRWLDSIQEDASAIFLLGDVFDFWFEYRNAIPKGFIRLLGKLAEMADRGVLVYLFTGNHDLWMFDYFPQELGVPVINNPISIQINHRHFHIGHGDGLGPGDRTYKVFKKVFTSRVAQRLFSLVHPDWGISFARRWSAYSRHKNLTKDESFRAKEDEWIYQYCVATEQKRHHDYYIFGHRHLVLDIPIDENSRYINTGEWMHACHYACFDGSALTLVPFLSDGKLQEKHYLS